ncbi:MAG: hypothetical protein PVH68_04880 [Armatimonadota bacterium]
MKIADIGLVEVTGERPADQIRSEEHRVDPRALCAARCRCSSSGAIHRPEAPGLGIEMDPEKARARREVE